MRPLDRIMYRVCTSMRGEVKLLAASVKPGFTLVVVFDDRTTLGVVRWRLATLVDRLSGLLGSQEHRKEWVRR